jgi:hypothetical protein
MSTTENKGWTVNGALSVLNAIPRPGGDVVFIPDYQTILEAEEFLKNLRSEEDKSIQIKK